MGYQIQLWLAIRIFPQELILTIMQTMTPDKITIGRRLGWSGAESQRGAAPAGFPLRCNPAYGLEAHDTIEQAQRILRDGDAYTLFIHRGTAIYVAVLQRTQSGKAVFLKSFRRGNERDAETQLRKAQRSATGQVLKDEW